MPPTGDPSAQPPVGPGPSLADVLPSVARSLGVPWPRRGPDAAGFDLPPTRRAVTVLVDGLGHDLLVRRAGHAPWLRAHLATTRRVASGFPSTTATSMGTFGTGLAAGAHGMLGYEVLVPGTDRLLNELSWEDGPNPRTWQPHDTVFEAVARAGVEVVRVGPAYFDGSGLTEAALRGGRFAAANTLPARVDATLAAVRSAPRALVHLYWGDLDKIGHVEGCDSWQWGDELESIDRELARLAASLPDDCSLTVTADHGMVDSPHELRLDVAHEPLLAAGVRHVTAEARAPAALRRARRPRRRARRVGRAARRAGPGAHPRARPWPQAGSGRSPPTTCPASATSSSRCAVGSPSSTRAAPAPSCWPCAGCTAR